MPVAVINRYIAANRIQGIETLYLPLSFMNHWKSLLLVLATKQFVCSCVFHSSYDLGIWSYDPLPKATTHDQRRRPSTKDHTTIPTAAPPVVSAPNPPKTLSQIEAYGMSWLNRKISGMDNRYILEGHTDRVTSLVCFQAQGLHHLISVSCDSNIIFWDLNRDTHHMRKVIPSGHEDFILDVAYSPETGDFATCSG